MFPAYFSRAISRLTASGLMRASLLKKKRQIEDSAT